jgi:hypothetical protein
MLRGPKQPSSPGRLNDHARQTASHVQQRGAAGAGGSMTTKGWIPNRPRPVIARGGTSDTIVAAPLNMVLRGEFSNALNYSAGDVVIVMGGDNAGSFVATVPVVAGSSEEPGVGNSWQRISSFTFGQWS